MAFSYNNNMKKHISFLASSTTSELISGRRPSSFHPHGRMMYSNPRVQVEQQPHRVGLVPPSTTRLWSSRQTNNKNNDNDDREDVVDDGINYGLVIQNLLNQALIGGGTLFTSGGAGYEILMSKAQFDLGSIVLGVIGLVPLLALSTKIEQSESYALSGLNLSTNMAVLRLYGSRPKPIPTIICSAAMAILTGFVEETTFRGQATPFFANQFGDGNIMVGAVLSTLLFAFLHTNPTSFFKGGEEAADNLVLFIFQLLTGSIFCTLYLVTGNLAVSIITHALYDFYTFEKVYLVDVAGQMEYAKQQSVMPRYRNLQQAQKWSTERGSDFIKGVQQSFYLMDTNRDGVLSRKELRVALFSYGINLSQVQSEAVLASADTDQQGDIDLDEFLAFVGPTGSARKAVRNTLFGPL